LVATVGSLPEQVVYVPRNATIGEAIGSVFGQKLRNRRLLLQNEKDETITIDTKADEVETVKITPWTEGG